MRDWYDNGFFVRNRRKLFSAPIGLPKWHQVLAIRQSKTNITALSLFTKTVLQEIQQNSDRPLISGPQSDLSTVGTEPSSLHVVDIVTSILTYVTYGT